MKKNFLRAFFCLNSKKCRVESRKSHTWEVKGREVCLCTSTCPTLELVFFRLPERQGSSSPGDKLLCVRFADLVGERESEREREELRSFVIGFRLVEDMAALLTKMGSSAQARMLSHLWKRGVTTAVQQEVLPELPYDYNALEPVISAEIMLLHHQKHHQAYVTGFNKALEQLTTASDPQAVVALQSAINFNGGGDAPGLIFGVHPVSINLCILIQYPIVP
jgi:hypothetical protein